MLQAIVFDFDGTILDTETPDFQTWQEIYRSHGVELPLDLWLQCVGGGDGFDPNEHLEHLTRQRRAGMGRGHAELPDMPDKKIDRRVQPSARAQTTAVASGRRLRAERRKRFLERVQAQPVMPGVLALIAAAERRGLKLAVASSSDRNWVESHLQRLNLRGHFAAVITADDVERVKPDPALYRLAAQALDVSPRRAVAIEDSYNGMLGAKRAGLLCVSVPNRITRASDFSAADLRLDSIASIAPDDLIAYFDGPPAARQPAPQARSFPG